MFRFRRTVFLFGIVSQLFGLDFDRSLSQYSRTVWTRQSGLPEDGIRAIAQTQDGYLWLGTYEGLARFDGYEFVTFNRDGAELPSNSINALAAGSDGSLWIGTEAGLVRYYRGTFRTHSTKDGLPANNVTALLMDHAGILWVVSGGALSKYEQGRFTTFGEAQGLTSSQVRGVAEDRNHSLYVAGYNSISRLEGGQFVSVIEPSSLKGVVVPSGVQVDRQGNLWILTTRALLERMPSGEMRQFASGTGRLRSLSLFRGLWADHEGNVWLGTDGGLAVIHGENFEILTHTESQNLSASCLFEDREGNVWIGSSGGLTRLRNDEFSVYGKSEGLPSNQPNVIYEDRSGHTWVGFADAGLIRLSRDFLSRGASAKNFESIASGNILAIRELPNGTILAASREGLIRYESGRVSTFVPDDPLHRKTVWDVLFNEKGRTWIAALGGVGELRDGHFRMTLKGSPPVSKSILRLADAGNGGVWAGSSGDGLWLIKDSGVEHYTTANGLASDQVRSLYVDSTQTLWVGTSGGGLSAVSGGAITTYRMRDGLLSDNIAGITDDGESLWLSTPLGICRVARNQLRDFSQRKISRLKPVNYAHDDVRGEQASPQTGAGGGRHRDGSIWFATNRGVAVYLPGVARQTLVPPMAHILGAEADGRKVDTENNPQLESGTSRLAIRYTSVHLGAPEQVEYSYRVDGWDTDWIPAGTRRVVDYTGLKHGDYQFHVRAFLRTGESSEASFGFTVLPHVWETAWFQGLAAVTILGLFWIAYQYRLRQLRAGYDLVLQERLRLARELHDTLTQAFVGISSQLDALQVHMLTDADRARKSLDLARRMARHSLTEAHRSVMDLRADALERNSLTTALHESIHLWTDGSGVDAEVKIVGAGVSLPHEIEQNILRIAQEATTNVIKHAAASHISVHLVFEPRNLTLRIEDNGAGFDPRNVFVGVNGNFGLIGMRERAARIGGQFRVNSLVGQGTHLELVVPLS